MSVNKKGEVVPTAQEWTFRPVPRSPNYIQEMTEAVLRNAPDDLEVQRELAELIGLPFPLGTDASPPGPTAPDHTGT